MILRHAMLIVALLYPIAAYFVGLYLRAAVSRIILKEVASNWLMAVIYFFSDICVLIFATPVSVLLTDNYAVPTINAVSAAWGIDICQKGRICGLYWSMSAASDIVGMCALAVTYGVLRHYGRVAMCTVTSVVRFAAVYLGLILFTLTANYIIYQYVDAELEEWRDVFPQDD